MVGPEVLELNYTEDEMKKLTGVNNPKQYDNCLHSLKGDADRKVLQCRVSLYRLLSFLFFSVSV